MAALDTYASTLAWAQGQARQAINAWNAAQTATKTHRRNIRRTSSRAGHVAEEIGAGLENAGGEVVNALASVGNAMLHHPGDVAEMAGGALLAAAGVAGVGASGLLDATVVLSPAGVALGGVSVLGVGAGATMAMTGARDVSAHAGDDDEVSPASTDHTAGDEATDLGPDLTDDGVVPNVEERYLKNGRVGYWDPEKEAVVIEDGDGGTVFTPKEGKSYLDKLK